MFNWFKQFRKPKVKKIAFIDGDQGVPQIINAYQKHLRGIETHMVRMLSSNANEPKSLRGKQGFNKIYLRDMTVGKEVVDKFIAAYIQKVIHNGYNDITVVSNDYDFVDIFKMTAKLHPDKNLTFRIIVPCGQGRIAKNATHLNIEFVHMNQ